MNYSQLLFVVLFLYTSDLTHKFPSFPSWFNIFETPKSLVNDRVIYYRHRCDHSQTDRLACLTNIPQSIWRKSTSPNRAKLQRIQPTTFCFVLFGMRRFFFIGKFLKFCFQVAAICTWSHHVARKTFPDRSNAFSSASAFRSTDVYFRKNYQH